MASGQRERERERERALRKGCNFSQLLLQVAISSVEDVLKAHVLYHWLKFKIKGEGKSFKVRGCPDCLIKLTQMIGRGWPIQFLGLGNTSSAIQRYLKSSHVTRKLVLNGLVPHSMMDHEDNSSKPGERPHTYTSDVNS